MNIYWKLLGGHVHMRVFMNGAKMGDLVCRREEFNEVRDCMYPNSVNWIEEQDG